MRSVMFHARPRRDAAIALAVWLTDMLLLFVYGWIHVHADTRAADGWCLIVSYVPALLATVIVLVRDHDLTAIGLGRGHLKPDSLMLLAMLATELLIGVYIYRMSWNKAVPNLVYYMFQIAMAEGVVYRGLIQNYLFGLPLPHKAVFLIGAAMFTLSHLPFQLQVRPWDLTFTIQLCITFVSHLLYCWIASERNNLLVPWGIHVAQDFLQVM